MHGVLPTRRHHCPRLLEGGDGIAMTYALKHRPPRQGMKIDEKNACQFHFITAEVKGRTPRGTLVPVDRPPSIPSERAFGRFGHRKRILYIRIILVSRYSIGLYCLARYLIGRTVYFRTDTERTDQGSGSSRRRNKTTTLKISSIFTVCVATPFFHVS
jgi:hypothetical protein